MYLKCLCLKDEEHVYYSGVGGDVDQSLLQDYFNLSVDLPKLYKQWSLVSTVCPVYFLSKIGIFVIKNLPQFSG